MAVVAAVCGASSSGAAIAAAIWIRYSAAAVAVSVAPFRWVACPYGRWAVTFAGVARWVGQAAVAIAYAVEEPIGTACPDSSAASVFAVGFCAGVAPVASCGCAIVVGTSQSAASWVRDSAAAIADAVGVFGCRAGPAGWDRAA